MFKLAPMRLSSAVLFVAVLAGAMIVVPAAAQLAPPRLPAPASPLPAVEVPPLPVLKPIPPTAEEPRPTDEEADLRVAIAQVIVEGMTIYGADTIADAIAPLVGEAIPVAAIDTARLAILRRYRDDGYALTAVSAIVEANGVLRIRVTEGRIAEVKLDGDIGPAGVQVLRFLRRLTAQPVIDTAALERALLLAGDVPGISLSAVLRPSASEPGALTLVAQVSRQALAGQVSADNRAFSSVGPEQLLGVFDANSFSEYGEHTQLQLYRTLNGAQIFGQASIDSFIGDTGLRIRLYAGRGVSRPTGSFRSIGYVGGTTLVGAELSYPLIRSRRQTLNLLGNFDLVNAAVDQTGEGSRDNLRIVRLGLDYVLSDFVLGNARGGISSLTLRASQGLSALGASPIDGPVSRPGQIPAFRKMSAELSRTQTLLQPWEGANIALQGVIAGQYSRDVLPSAEKFFLGGTRLARGYYYGEVTGDNALAGTVELQFNTVNETDLFGTHSEWSSQLYGFYDWAQTWENLAGEQGRRLRSTGIGLRLVPSPRIEIGLELVRRLTRFPSGSGPGIAALPADAFFWRMLVRF